MAAKVFSRRQKTSLVLNDSVQTVFEKRIFYTDEFKITFMKEYLAGKKPTQIFREAGFDPALLGNKRIERASARWRALYAEGKLAV